MRLKVKLKEDNMRLKVKFGEIYQISDGGYDQGYTEGYNKGYDRGYAVGFSEGETKGKAEGYNQGYDVGLADGENQGYTKGYEAGYQAGYAKGKEDGYAEGHSAGYTEGIEQGKQAEYDAFWNAYQENGNRIVYDYAFYGRGWTEDTFAPKYDMQPTSATSMFQYSYSSTINLKEGLAKNGVKLDFSKCTSMSSCFNYASLGDLPELDLRSLSAIPLMFYDCRSKVIDKIILKADGSQTFSNPFNTCRSLEEIRFEGVIGRNGLNFQWSNKLSHDSLVSIINALSTTTSDLAITFSQVAVNTAFETAEGLADGSTSPEWLSLIGTRSNWTISLK